MVRTVPAPVASRAVIPLVVLWLALGPGCTSTPEVDPRYRASASVLEIVAVLRHHVPDDTYRFPPARDFTGRNVYRSSLLRLESLTIAHAPALRAGHMDGVIAFAKARALERIRAFDLAAGEYQIAAEREQTLRSEALRSADLCAELDRARKMVSDPTPEKDGDVAELLHPDEVLARFDARAAHLESVARIAEGTHHAAVVLEELERNDIERAHYFVSLREVVPDGDVRAVGELQRVAMRHRDSKLAAAHLLALADLYADLSIQYVDEHPPESLEFDPTEFRDLVDSTARVYEMVSARDGTPEKLEAQRRLEAFLAFSLRIDRDRFTP